MAHGITSVDGLVLTGQRAWHGLGTIVENAPTATEALQIARLGWTVERMPVSAMGMDGALDLADEYRALRRSDTGELFAIVGDGYAPVQNTELAAFADAMGQDGSVKIETAGSIRAGRRVWFLARGESVWATERDEVKTYLLLANGHDGSLALTVQPTSVRVVCRNTLHMALGKAGAVRMRHEGNMAEKIEQARKALGLFSMARDGFVKQVEALNSRSFNTADVQAFFVDVYTETVEPIPATPSTKAEREAREEAAGTIRQWARNFDRDRANTGGAASAWTALNAVTEWFDHQKTARGANDHARAEARTFSKLWGTGSDAKGKALKLALSTV